MKLYYPAVYIKSEHGYTVEFPDLPGCITQGDTFEEAFEMAQDAACGWILTSIEDSEEINAPNSIEPSCGEPYTVNMMQLDIDDYAIKHSSKSIKKTLTVPQWLNSLAESKDINFSKVLQNALKAELGLKVVK